MTTDDINDSLSRFVQQLDELSNLAEAGLLKSERLHETKCNIEDQLLQMSSQLDERSRLTIEKQIPKLRNMPKSGIFLQKEDALKQIAPLKLTVQNLIEELKVRQRYSELAGLIRDGEMVNRDKEQRAREYVKQKNIIVERLVSDELIKRNSKYGELIIQANEVQFFLTTLISLRSFTQTKKIKDRLERAQMGQLIHQLEICAKNQTEADLATSLEKYKEARDALAHKMFSVEKLTPQECEGAIELGRQILEMLKHAIKT